MPADEDPLCLENILSLSEVLNEVVSIMGDLRPHVVDVEGLREVIFVVREGHRLEVEGHHCASLDIADFVEAGCRVHVSVEVLGNASAVLGEVRVCTALIPLLIVVNNVVVIGREEFLELLILEDLVEHPYLVHHRLHTLVSDASQCHHREEGEVDFPEKSLVEHHETKSGVGGESSGPAVVHAVEATPDLVQIISGLHAEFPHIVFEDVVSPSELARVTLCLVAIRALHTPSCIRVMVVDSIDSLRGSETFVVETRAHSFTEIARGSKEHLCLRKEAMSIWDLLEILAGFLKVAASLIIIII